MDKEKYHVKKDDKLHDVIGDKTAYGEFISTFHRWTGLEENEKRAQELVDATKPDNGELTDKYKIKFKEE